MDHLPSVLDDCLIACIFNIPLPPLLVSAVPAKNRGDGWLPVAEKKFCFQFFSVIPFFFVDVADIKRQNH
jgi:hypothetical protein